MSALRRSDAETLVEVVGSAGVIDPSRTSCSGKSQPLPFFCAVGSAHSRIFAPKKVSVGLALFWRDGTETLGPSAWGARKSLRSTRRRRGFSTSHQSLAASLLATERPFRGLESLESASAVRNTTIPDRVPINRTRNQGFIAIIGLSKRRAKNRKSACQR